MTDATEAVPMETENIVEKTLRRYPDFRRWIYPVGKPGADTIVIHYAVIDRWRSHADDVDALYRKLRSAITDWNASHETPIRPPSKADFAVMVRLFLTIVPYLPWDSEECAADWRLTAWRGGST
ncbi:hypothetical protein QBK93_31040 [Rhizobium leguminosarum]|uniref:hypothetical protein n=1 Tax=Rhizobium leguminosarum TaxID=384 RepID=UPI0024A8C54B|nr:hypothetical protein [Rhizobium leguminosarum]MDI5929082.1 hypothetical protein [Rhizobium leguminosarum]